MQRRARIGNEAQEVAPAESNMTLIIISRRTPKAWREMQRLNFLGPRLSTGGPLAPVSGFVIYGRRTGSPLIPVSLSQAHVALSRQFPTAFGQGSGLLALFSRQQLPWLCVYAAV